MLPRFPGWQMKDIWRMHFLNYTLLTVGISTVHISCKKTRLERRVGKLPNLNVVMKKSCIQDTKNLSTDADGRTDTILERLHDLSLQKKSWENPWETSGKSQENPRKTPVNPVKSPGKPREIPKKTPGNPRKTQRKPRENPGKKGQPMRGWHLIM